MIKNVMCKYGRFFPALFFMALVCVSYAEGLVVVLPEGADDAVLPWCGMLNDLSVAFAVEPDIRTENNSLEDITTGTVVCFSEEAARKSVPAEKIPLPIANEIFIKTYHKGGIRLFAVIAPTISDKVYGGTFLGEEIRLNGNDSDIDVHLRTPFTWRLASDNEENALRYGYNTVVVQKANPSRFVFFKQAEPKFILPGTPAYQRILANRRWLAERLSAIKKAGLSSCVVCDEFIFPIELVRSKWKDRVVRAERPTGNSRTQISSYGNEIQSKMRRGGRKKRPHSTPECQQTFRLYPEEQRAAVVECKRSAIALLVGSFGPNDPPATVQHKFHLMVTKYSRRCAVANGVCYSCIEVFIKKIS